MQCIRADSELGPIQETYCDPEPLCLDVEECVIGAGCFLPVPAACYCGPNVDGCDQPTFVPTVPCAAEIRAGLGDAFGNAEVLDRFFSFEYPTGVAMLILDEASRVCPTDCSL